MAEAAGVEPASQLSPALRFQQSGLAYAQHLRVPDFSYPGMRAKSQRGSPNVADQYLEETARIERATPFGAAAFKAVRQAICHRLRDIVQMKGFPLPRPRRSHVRALGAFFYGGGWASRTPKAPYRDLLRFERSGPANVPNPPDHNLKRGGPRSPLARGSSPCISWRCLELHELRGAYSVSAGVFAIGSFHRRPHPHWDLIPARQAHRLSG